MHFWTLGGGKERGRRIKHGPALILTAGVLVAGGCGSPEEGPVLVFAGASVADAVGELAVCFTAAGGPPVEVSAGSSTALQRQIEAGAPADLFVAAAPEPVEDLVAGGLAQAGDRVDLLTNRLVCVVQAGTPVPPAAPADLLSTEWGRIAMADPEVVPAGRYGRQALTSLDLWESLEPRLLPADDVRTALGYVETGAAGAGIVYATDAAVSGRVQVAFTIPAATHSPIVYSAVVPRTAPRPAAARELLRLLASRRGDEVFRAAGFTPLSAAGRVP